jgi:TrmH family RNA methyltransferase
VARGSPREIGLGRVQSGDEPMERISSRQNPIVRRFRELARAPHAASDGTGRDVLLDGSHLLEEALACGLSIEAVAVREDLADGALAPVLACAGRRGARILPVAEPVLSAMSPVRQPSGIIAIARHRDATLDAVLGRAPQMVLVLVDVQDPGNVGAVVRVADACGATGIVPSAATADPFGWKALRGSMGGAFRVPVAPRGPVDGALAAARDRGIRLYAAVPRDGTPLPRCDLRGPSAVLLGGEGAGLDEALAARCDDRLTIPMRTGVESLNVAAAAAIVTYEAQRQRHRDR